MTRAHPDENAQAVAQTNEPPRIKGLNHLTLAVRELDCSIRFYCDILGFILRAQWEAGAYLEAGSLWLCLSLDQSAKDVTRTDYTHYAFDVLGEDFQKLAYHIRKHAVIWKDNVSEGASLYFLDPDGHKLEIHVGSLATRLKKIEEANAILRPNHA